MTTMVADTPIPAAAPLLSPDELDESGGGVLLGDGVLSAGVVPVCPSGGPEGPGATCREMDVSECPRVVTVVKTYRGG